MWDGVIETRDFVKHTIQNARFRKTHTKNRKAITHLRFFTYYLFTFLQVFQSFNGNHIVVIFDKIVNFFRMVILIGAYYRFNHQALIQSGYFVTVELRYSEEHLQCLLQLVGVVEPY